MGDTWTPICIYCALQLPASFWGEAHGTFGPRCYLLNEHRTTSIMKTASESQIKDRPKNPMLAVRLPLGVGNRDRASN